LSHYKQSLNIRLTYLSPNDPELASTYSNIGLVLKEQGDLNGALEHYEHALNIEIDSERSDQTQHRHFSQQHWYGAPESR
jgi:tetratricopeptide (TPR) repeat protein